MVSRQQLYWRIEVWDEARWLSERAAHSSLLKTSQADPLFLSWEWLTTWWSVFGARKRRELCCLAVYRGSSLLGLAPLYTRTEIRGGVIPVRSLQMVGLGWRDDGCQTSEYLDALVMEGCRADVLSIIGASIKSLEWNEIAVGFSESSAELRNAIAQLHHGESGYLREIEPSTSYQADLSAGFEAYLKSLGASSRRSLWTLRHRLDGARFDIANSEDSDRMLADLNRLHSLRWGEAVFSDERLRFHQLLSRRLAESVSEIQVIFSRLWSGSKMISVLYDIRVGKVQYNIQMGFDPTYNTRVSLGLLHLGYAMEHAAKHGVKSYDFLAGPGKKTDYKCHLAQRSRALSSLQYVRGSYLPSLYRWHDRWNFQGTRNR